MALSEDDIDLLEKLLFSDDLENEALDYFGIHGLISASIVGPTKLSNAAIKEIIFDSKSIQLNEASLEHLVQCTDKIAESIQDDLAQGADISLPYLEEETDFDACLKSWCIGFMEGLFFDETTWFSSDEEVTAELLLPIMVVSGLFEPEEFRDIASNDKLMSELEDLIPSQLVDIYLYYQDLNSSD